MAAQGGQAGRPSVLIVDDRPENLQALGAVVEPLECRVVTATSGREALRLLLEDSFAVILLDVQMPEMDGFETASYIRERERTRAIPIIFLSAVSASSEHVFRGYEAGAVDYIIKPIDPMVLRSKVGVFLELWERGEQIARQAEVLRVREQERAKREAAERRHQRTAFLENLTVALEQRADVRGRTAQLVRACVPDLADFAIVELFADETREQIVTLAHADGAEERALEEHLRTLRDAGILDGPAGAAPAPRVEPTASRETWLEMLPEPLADPLWHRLAPETLIVVPLVLQRRPFGKLILGRAGSTEPYGEDELELARHVARRASLAVENSRLYEVERERSRTLQLSLLGESVVENSSVTTATRYIAGSADLEVGGDWYDVIEREDGRIYVVVGDVVGRGIRAATAMGKLRSAIGALALVTDGPAKLLERVDHFATRIDEAHLATVVCVLLDPDQGLIRYSSAGHLPPLLVSESGAAEFLDGGRGFPLGVGDIALDRLEEQTALAPGSTLILFTDGLVESRTVSIERGLERLLAAAVERAAHEPERLCDELVTELVDGPGDDVALVCLRLEPRPADLLVRRYRAVPAEVRAARHELAEWLEKHGVGPDPTSDLVLALGEACSNAVQHAYRNGDGEFVVELRLHADGNLVVRVSDRGRWSDRKPLPERGRGLDIIRNLVDEAHVHGTPQGTTISMQKRLRAPAKSRPRAAARASASR